MKQHVAELIIQEMKSFTPNRTYIEHLPYPKLTFSRSQTLQVWLNPFFNPYFLFENEMARVAKKTPMEKIDISKYEAEKPEGLIFNAEIFFTFIFVVRSFGKRYSSLEKGSEQC
jgi:hypothetical protein